MRNTGCRQIWCQRCDARRLRCSFGPAFDGSICFYNNKLRGGTRSEYRLVRISSFLTKYNVVAGDVLVIARAADGSFLFAIERLLDPNSDPRFCQLYVETKLDDGWIIGLPVTEPEADDETYAMEGQEHSVLSRWYERSSINRRMAIEIHGRICIVCRFSFDASYGSLAGGYVEIHHLVPVTTMKGLTSVDPRENLVPLCTNCHQWLIDSGLPIHQKSCKEHFYKANRR